MNWLLGLCLSAFGIFVLAAVIIHHGISESHLEISIFVPAIVIGFILAAMRWHRTLFYKTHGVFEYRFGRLAKYEPYDQWTLIELGPLFHPLRVVRSDGSTWNLPLGDSDEFRLRGEILWLVDRAGVEIPDQVARRNRVGIGALTPYSRKAYRERKERWWRPELPPV
ncbi:MAG: hypothetical protein RLN72_05005 [Henriciella sp.]